MLSSIGHFLSLMAHITGQKVAQYASQHLHNRIMRSEAFGELLSNKNHH